MTDIRFDTACAVPRPIRLDEKTRLWAWESLQGRYGDEAIAWDSVSLDDIEGFEALSPLDQYDMAIRRIAEEAPLRYVPGEVVSGSATLGLATQHCLPARRNGKPVMGSISHLTLDFESVVSQGISEKERLLAARLAETELTARERRFLESCKSCLEAMHIYHARYMDYLAGKADDNAERLRQVPFGPARTFMEALQSIWFTFSFTRLCGNWPGIGRLDKMLSPLLDKDLREGRITREEARAALASFFIKGCEWVRTMYNSNSGDGQNYQNIVLCGVNEEGEDISSLASELILDVVEELPIGDFPITIRLNSHTPEAIKAHAARVIRHGGGVIAFYNEELILHALTDFGYSLCEARNFANDGCWEIQVPGKTHFGYIPFDGLAVLLKDTLHLDGTPAHFDDMASLKAAYFENLRLKIESIYQDTVHRFFEEDSSEWRWREGDPCTVVSLFEGGCLESGRSYVGGGTVYTVVAPHIGGAPDVGNSLRAIDRLCFIEHKISFDDLMTVLKNNWEDEEALRQYALRRISYYGNDDDEADAYTACVLSGFADLVKPLNGRCPVLFPAGVSTFGRQIEWAPQRTATPFGRRYGDILSGNASPTPGTDIAGATAIIASYCKTPLDRLVNGAALDIKLSPSAVSGENGVEALSALEDGFCALGGCFMQIDVLDAETLKRAQEDPDSYRTLSVRVSGWNARFITLDRSWQRMIIERTEHGF